jgi:Coenzyme PQQ synthesis protein D (PqqD)
VVSPGSKYHERVWEFPVPGGMVLAAPRRCGLYLLNPSAAFIWEELRLGSAPDQIGKSLAEAYQLTPEVAHRDVDTILRRWDALLGEAVPEADVARGSEPQSGPCVTTTYCWNETNFYISLDSPELEAEIRPRLAKLQTTVAEPAFGFSLMTTDDAIYVYFASRMTEPELIATEDSVSAARAILLQEIIRRTNDQQEWLSILHAGACGKNSSCVIFPAASHSGKSTLAAVMMERGLSFYADDSVGVETGSLQIPCMPFGVAIREGSWNLIGNKFPGFLHSPIWRRFGENIRFLYPSVDASPAQAVAIVFTTYRCEAAFSVRRLNTLETLLGLQQSGFWIDAERDCVASFLKWLQSMPCYELTYDDADRACDFIEGFLKE